MKIGTIDIPQMASLAPMAGVADTAMRQICRKYGAAYVVGEMASAKGMHYSDRKTAELLQVTGEERPVANQIFGSEPEVMAQAAIKAAAFSPDFIDINMGCPAPKIAGNGGGSALMKDPRLAGEIVRAVVDAVNIPVTVKFRKGWDDETVNAVEFAKIVEDSGASVITIHGRTRKQMYTPPVDLDIIAKVKQAVRIPVVGNGDVVDIASAVRMYEQTGCDLVMIGRGALGSPWIFEQIAHYFATGEVLPEPPLEEKMRVMRHQVSLMCQYKGEKGGMREARKHAAWYMKGLHGAAKFRRMAGGLTVEPDIDRLVECVLAEYEKQDHEV